MRMKSCVFEVMTVCIECRHCVCVFILSCHFCECVGNVFVIWLVYDVDVSVAVGVEFDFDFIIFLSGGSSGAANAKFCYNDASSYARSLRVDGAGTGPSSNAGTVCHAGTRSSGSACFACTWTWCARYIRMHERVDIIYRDRSFPVFVCLFVCFNT